METIWDWITVAAFAGLVLLLLQRSMEDEPRDHLWQYLPPALGCMGANYLGNEGYPLPAVLVMVAVAVYVVRVLRVPLKR